MRSFFIGCLVALVALTSMSPADAGRKRFNVERRSSPEASARLSTKVLASDGCWRACEAQCGKQVRKCVRGAGLTDCLPYNDACGRICVKYCRTYGGPLLNWTN